MDATGHAGAGHGGGSSEAGGTVGAGQGGEYTHHAIGVPPGALAKDEELCVRLPEQIVPCPVAALAEFGPSGLVFSIAAVITIEFTGDDIAHGHTADEMWLYVWNGSLWEKSPEVIVDTENVTVSAQVGHLSVFCAAVPADSDGDGLEDIDEAAAGTNPHDADTDSDDISDFDEVAYDGDGSRYNPYNAQTNRTGTDLDPTLADTDGDGIADGHELTRGTDPLAPPDTVEFTEFATLALAWLSGPGDAHWNPACDVSIPSDDTVDFRDLVVFTSDWLMPVEAFPVPIAHWTFDEGAGDTAGDSMGAHHGVVYGAAWTTGKVGGALSFDGRDDYVDCGAADVLAPEQMTVALWVYAEGDLTNQYILGKAIDLRGARDYMISTDGAGKLTFYFGEDDPSKRREVKAGSTLPTGQWIHVAVTRDGSTASLYVNGQLEGSAMYGFTPVNKGHALRIGSIGSSDGWAGYFEGKIDDVRLYEVALTAEDVTQLYEEAL